jgi:hypothetical protein
VTKKTVRSIVISLVIAALFFGLGWQIRQHSDKRTVSDSSSTVSEEPHPIGTAVDLPGGFDATWISGGYMKHSGVGKVSVLKIAVSATPSNILVENGPKSYEVDVLTRVCANALGFQAVTGSHSADIADVVSIHLQLIPLVQRGINEFYFGNMEISDAGTPPTLIHQRPLTLALTMRPYQCFTGVATYAVPVQIGGRANLTRYAVALTSSSWGPGVLQSIWWSSGL